MAEPKWWETQLHKNQVEELKRYYRYLSKKYGQTVVIPTRFTLDDYMRIQKEPEYQEWARLGKPDISGVTPEPAVQRQVDFSVGAQPPWEQMGMSESEFTSQYPSARSYYETSKNAAEMGLSRADYLRSMAGFPTSADIAQQEAAASQFQQSLALQQQQAQIQREQQAREFYFNVGLPAWERQRNIEFETAQQRAMAIRGTPMFHEAGWAAQEQERQENETNFERMRQNVLSSIQGSSRDWIKRYQAEQGVGEFANPFRRTGPLLNAGEDFRMQELIYDSLSKQAKDATKILKENERSIDAGEGATITQMEMDAAREVLARQRDAAKTIFGMKVARDVGAGILTDEASLEIAGRHPSQRDVGVRQWEARGGGGVHPSLKSGQIGTTGEPPPPPPATPLMPEWVKRVSGIGAARVPETKTDILIPSGQMWQNLLPSQQQMFEGLVEFAGKRSFEDIEALRKSMLPRTIGGGSRVIAARQL